MSSSEKNVQDAPGPASGNDTRLLQPPALTLPKGGGAIRGIGEKFSANPVTGTLGSTIPLSLSPGRNGFGPQISLSYDSGAGNGPFGFGWSLSVPRIARKTEKGLPLYDDARESDTFVLSDAEDLVPQLKPDKTPDELPRSIGGVNYNVRRYRPRIDNTFSRIERWTRVNGGDTHWRVTTRDNVTSVFGDDPLARIVDPADPSRVFAWLLSSMYDDRGNLAVYQYKREDGTNVVDELHERNRERTANRYLKYLYYGHDTPFVPGQAHPNDWRFCCVFDYGDHDPLQPTVAEQRPWNARHDAFSTFRSGFEVRTHRRCERILMFHRFAELGPNPVLTRATELDYEEELDASAVSRSYLASFIARVHQRGYLPDFTSKAIPPVEFHYSRPQIDPTLHRFSEESMQNLPVGFGSRDYQLVDLDGEGINGVLAWQGASWLFKRGAPTFDDQGLATPGFLPIETLPLTPSSAVQAGGFELMDLDGGGQLALVDRSSPAAGFFARTESGGWESYRPFEALPLAALSSRSARFLDLDGDGRADVLIAGDEVLSWHPSLGRTGFGAEAGRVPMLDEDRGPRLVFAEATETIFVADMSGDGLGDLVRIEPGCVVYWPNLGYGRFGPKITMSGAPAFDFADTFDPARIRLADIDGTGTSDLIYIGRDAIDIYFNRSGNGFAPPERITSLPRMDSCARVQVADLAGNGTAALVWSTTNPHGSSPLCFIDLMGGIKPHLLVRIVNNLGAETRVRYAPSTRYYVEDRAAGRPWLTKLPFPVHVVAEIETFDHVSKIKSASRFAYHDGYFDVTEREFRGFGKVEQWDTQTLQRFSGQGLFTEVPLTAGDEFHLPPVRTVTWFHTGALQESGLVSRHYESEYWGGDAAASLLPDSDIPPGLTLPEEREALRALRGKPLRSEVYAEDGTALAGNPYVVTEYTYAAVLLQERGSRRHASFRVMEVNSLVYHYERDPSDPRISQSLVLESDRFGVVRRSATVAYARRPVAARLPEQERWEILYTEVDVAHRDDEPAWYRVGVPVEVRKYELNAPPPAGAWYTSQELSGIAAAAPVRPYEVDTPPTIPSRRLVERQRLLYRSEDLATVLPVGTIASRALTYQTYSMVLTPGQVSTLFPGVTDPQFEAECGFVRLAGDTAWWVASGTACFSANASDSPAVELATARVNFFQPVRQRDPFGQETVVTLDVYRLFPIETRDPLGNRMRAKMNYRTLTAQKITDANGNATAIRADPLGMVRATFVLGKPGEGDRFDDASDESSLLDDPTSTFDYALDAFQLLGVPVSAHARVRERHGDAATPWQESWVYSDGAGSEVLKKVRVEAGDAPLRNPDGTLRRDLAGNVVVGPSADRFIGTGRILRDNKGHDVKSYEPFFDSTPAFTSETDLVQIGVTPIKRYDPLGRLVRTELPDGTFSRTTFTAWSQTSADESDTVLESRWYVDRGSPDPLGPEPAGSQARAAWLSARQANTPSVTHLDCSGRPIIAITDNGVDAANVRSLARSVTVFDATGTTRFVRDARDRVVLEYVYDCIGRRLRTRSMEAGDRTVLLDATGKPVRLWDSRGFITRMAYDPLRRPTHHYVSAQGGAEVLAERMAYGESHPDASRNLKGQLFLHFDSAGLARSDRFDFKGNLLESTRRVCVDYRRTPYWDVLNAVTGLAALEAAADPLLEQESWQTRTRFDALNRMTQAITPGGRTGRPSVTQPRYNTGGLLESIFVWNRRAAAPAGLLPEATADDTVVTSIVYDAKGQRLSCAHGSGVQTTYSYDPLTFRLLTLRVERGAAFPAAERTVQDLAYAYDAIGNIVEVRDAAQPDVFFRNQRVTATMQYAYDPLQRLVLSRGREHLGRPAPAGSLNGPQQTVASLAGRLFAHPHDGTALGTYTERFEYDLAGNLLQMRHEAESGTWVRYYRYDEASQIEPAKRSNRLTATTRPGDDPIGAYSDTYGYDAHGNITSTAHLAVMTWDFRDRLATTATQVVGPGLTPETTYYVYDSAGQRIRKVVDSAGSPAAPARRRRERIYLGNFEVYRDFAADGVTLELERETLHVGAGSTRAALIETKTLDTPGGDPSPLDVSQLRHQHANHLGTVTVELARDGSLITYEEYYAFGSTAFRVQNAAARAARKRYSFCGKERDEESGFDYVGARYYASWLGRWTACDPAGLTDGPNLYVYVRNSPVMLSDPDGRATPPTPAPAAAEGVYGELMNIVEYGEKVLNRSKLGTNVQGDHPIQVALDKIRTYGEYTRDLSKAEGEFVVLAETGTGKFHTELGKLQLDIGKRTLAGDLWRGLTASIEEAAAAKGLKVVMPAPPPNLIMSQSQLVEETIAAYKAAAKATGATVNEAALSKAILSHMGVLGTTGGTLAETGAKLKNAPKLAEMVSFIAGMRRFSGALVYLEPLAAVIKPIASKLGPIGIVLTVMLTASTAHAATSAASRGDTLGAAQHGLDTAKNGLYLAGFRYPPALIPAIAIDVTEYADKKIGFSDYGAEKGVELKENLMKSDFFKRHDTSAEVLGGTYSVLKAWEYALVPGAMMRDKLIDKARAAAR